MKSEIIGRGALRVTAALAVAFCALATGRAAAQEPVDRQGAVRERAVVSRIVIDAHVIGPDGNPIPDLTVADFRVKVDGKQAIVEAVDWLPAGTPETDVSALVGIGPDEAERFRSDVPPGRLILMFFQTDQTISRLHGFMRMALQARQFLSTLLPTDRVAVASFDSHLKLRQDFTSDRAKIEKAIQSAIRTGPAPEADPDSRPAIARYLDRAAAKKAATPDRALELLARSVEPIPGGKSLLFFGWGLGSTVGGITGPVASESIDYSNAIYALARARISLFTLDVADADYHSLEGYLQQISDLTGGRYQKTNIFPSLAMELVRKAISGRYVLWIVNSGNTRGDHTIDVKLVDRKGYVYARQYYQD